MTMVFCFAPTSPSHQNSRRYRLSALLYDRARFRATVPREGEVRGRSHENLTAIAFSQRIGVDG